MNYNSALHVYIFLSSYTVHSSQSFIHCRTRLDTMGSLKETSPISFEGTLTLHDPQYVS